MRTVLATAVLLFCFAAVEAQVNQPLNTQHSTPAPALAKVVLDDAKSHVWIKGNWAYAIPSSGLDPVRVGDVRYRVTRKLYATLDDHVRGIGEGKETSTGWFSVAWTEGEGANGIINTQYCTYVAKGKVNRLTVDMVITGTYRADGESVPFTWSQQGGGVFHGEGVK